MSETDLAKAKAIFSNLATPPCAKTLGWTLVDADFQAGTVAVEFDAKQDFCNPAGFVQGGFLAAMLDDTMGPAVVVKSEGRLFTPTICLNVTFIAPARPGRITGRSRIVYLGKSTAALEAELFDDAETLLARSTASSRLIPMKNVGEF